MVSTSDEFKRKSDEFSKLVNNTKGNEMKYTAKQIKPKRYPDEKPNHSGSMWVFRNDGYWIDVGIYKFEPNYIGFTWFIDVPGAPPELKPLAYPENKPDNEYGLYMAHSKTYDSWEALDYEPYWWKYATIDYFINYDLRGDDKMDVIWEEEHLKVSYFMGGLPQVKIERHNSVPNDLIEIDANEFTEIASCWLELQGYDVVKREPMPVIKNCSHMDKDDGCCMHPLNQTPECHEYICPRIKLDKYTPCETEIAPCPNPECGGVCKIIHKSNKFYVWCKNCLYRAPKGETESEAIRLHNLIAKRAKAKSEYMDFGKGRE